MSSGFNIENLVNFLKTGWFMGLFIAFIVIVIVVQRRQAKARTAALQLIAEQLGFTFSPEAQRLEGNGWSDLQLFKRGHSKKFINLMAGYQKGISVEIFDYRYIIGGGKNSTIYWQTAVCLTTPKALSPSFTVEPEGILKKIGAALGQQDIDFETHPQFSGMFLLRGEDENSIRLAFHDAVMDFFVSLPGVSVEVKENQLLLYQLGKRSSPEDIATLLDNAMRLLSFFYKN